MSNPIYDEEELSVAISNNQPINILRNLMDNNTDVNHIYDEGLTALHIVCGLSNERLDIVTLLINNNAQFTSDNDNNTPIHLAAYKGHINIINLLINRFFDSGFLKNTVTTEPPISLQQVLNSKNGDGFTSLLLATSQNNIPIISILLDNGVDINIQDDDGDTPLQSALLYKHYDSADFLYSKGAIIDNRANNDGVTLLHVSVIAEFPDFVQKCINNDLDVNYSQKDGYTPLHFAAMIGNTSIVKILLDKGANVHSKDKDGNTPLHIAAQKHIELLRLLISKYDSLDLKNNAGMTPLHNAAIHNKYENIEFLLYGLGFRYIVNINAIDNDGQTPLNYAIQNSNIESVRVLIKFSKADISLINSFGLNAQQIALETKNRLAERLQAVSTTLSAIINQTNPAIAVDEVAEGERLRNQYISIILDRDSIKENYVNAIDILRMVTEYQSQQGTNTLQKKENVSKGFVGGTNTDNFEEIANSNFSDTQSDFYSDPLDNSSHSIRIATQDLRNQDMTVALDLMEKLKLKKDKRKMRLNRELIKELIYLENHRLLSIASKNVMLSIIEDLLKKGADPNFISEYSKAPLLIASKNNWLKIVKLLLKYGANTEIKIPKQGTPLIQAVVRGHRDMVILLIENGANVNHVQNTTNMTPLHWATLKNNGPILELLLKNGANSDLKAKINLMRHSFSNNEEKSALELARGIDLFPSGFPKALKVLNKYYAQKAYEKTKVAEIGEKRNIPANISGEYGTNIESEIFKDGEIQKFLGGMKPEDLTPEKLEELTPYLSSNSENNLYEYLDIFDRNHPRFYCKSVELKVDELEKWMIHTLFTLQGTFPSASFYIGGRIIPNTPPRRDLHFSNEENVNEKKLETEEDIQEFTKFLKTQSSNEILKFFKMFLLTHPKEYNHTGSERHLFIDEIPVQYKYYLFESPNICFNREDSDNYRFGIGGLVSIISYSEWAQEYDINRQMESIEELKLNIKAFQKKIIRICSYSAVEKSRQRMEDKSNSIQLKEEDEESLWSAVYNWEFYENIENGMSKDEANIQASKMANEIIADKKRDYGDSLEKQFSDMNV